MSQEKSTIVRTLSALAQRVPALAEPLLTELFVRAPPRQRLGEEVLARAQHDRVVIDGERVQTYRWGEGPTVLLVHGLGGSAGQFAAFVDPLVTRGYSVLAFDAPGHGRSSGNHATLVSMAHALSALTAKVGAPHASIAHSLGAAAVCLAHSQGAVFGRSVLVAPPADVRDWFQRFAVRFDLSEAMAARVQRRIEQRVGVPMSELEVGVLAPRIRAPVLVIHDADDREVPFAHGERAAKLIAGARLFATKGLGHRRILRDARVVEQALEFVGMPPRVRALAELVDVELFDPEVRWARELAS